MKTGVIGLGAMGAGMALNLHKTGHLHRLWNRTGERAAALANNLDLKAETGSSQTINLGLSAKALAIPILWRCPPLNS